MKKIIKKFLNSSLPLKIVLTMIFIVNIVLTFKPSVTIPGGISIYDSLPLFVSLMSYPVYLLLFSIMCVKYTTSKNDRMFVAYFVFFGFLIVGASIVLPVLDRIYYPNYVYSKLHIYIPAVVRFAQIQIMTVLCGLFFLNTKKVQNGLSRATWLQVQIQSIVTFKNVFAVILILAIYKAALNIPLYISEEYLQQYRAHTMDVDFRYRATDVPLTAYKALFVKNMTPENAVIIHPPQSEDFPDIGNEVLIRYFLYPRTLVSYPLLENYIKDMKGECHFYTILVRSSVDDELIFPYSTVETDNVQTLDFDNKTMKVFTDFDRSKITNDKEFLIGVLENKKCKTF